MFACCTLYIVHYNPCAMDEGRRSKYFYRPMIGDDDSCDDACVTADKAEVSIRCRRSSKRDAVEPKFIG